MRDNKPSHISDKKIEYIKRAKINEWKIASIKYRFKPNIKCLAIIKYQLMNKTKNSELITEIKFMQ